MEIRVENEYNCVYARFEVLTAVVMKSIFTDMCVSCSAYSTQKMEAICSAEASADFQRTTLLHILRDSTLQNTYTFFFQ
jgi:hypothetical protein